MRFLRMFTNSLLAGLVGAGYMTVLVLQLNPHVALVSGTTWRWFLTLGILYGLPLAIALYLLLLAREIFSLESLSPGWASVRVLAWLSAAGAGLAAMLMWLNANGSRAALGEMAAGRMTSGAVAALITALALLAIAIVHYSTGRRASRVGGALFALTLLGSVTLPLAARGPAVPAPAAAAAPAPAPMLIDRPPKVVMLLLDGASLEYIRTRSAEGRLPNFTRLLDAGASMYLATIRPTQPVPVWAAVATGMYPAKNGIRSSAQYFARGDTSPIHLLPDHCFAHALVRSGAIRTEPNSSTAWAARPFWSILSSGGLSSGLVRWPLTYPAAPVSGFVLTDRLHEAVESEFPAAGRVVYPPEVLQDVRRAFTAQAASVGQSPSDEDAAATRLDRQYLQAALALHRELAPQVLAVRLDALDRAGHRHYDEGRPFLLRNADEPDRRHAQRLERAYADVDAEVGGAIGALAPGDLLLVVSGFGMQRLHPLKELAARVLRDPPMRGSHERAPDGFLAAYGTPVQPGRPPRGSIVDVTPTLLYFLGLPVGRDMDGFVRTDLFKSEFTAERPIAFIATHNR